MSNNRMKYRRFGRTELQMPVLTCGGMRFQHDWKDAPTNTIPDEAQEKLAKTLHRALDLGINHIETARGYGTSEIQIGQVLPTIKRQDLILQTKVGVSDDVGEFQRNFDLSIHNLGVEYIDLFSIHGINDKAAFDQTMRKGGVLEQVRKLQDQRIIRHVGFSTHGAVDLIVKAIETNEFDYVNLHWYWVNHFNWTAVKAANARDMGVFIISPNDKGGKLYQPPEKLRALCAPLEPMTFNTLYCLARPQVHTLSIGAARPEDFDLHVAALDHYDHAATLVAPVVKRLYDEMVQVLGSDWTAHWWRNLPEHDQIPGDVNVREILRLWNYAKTYDMVEFGKMRYNLLGNAGNWFPGQPAKSMQYEAIRTALAGSAFAEKIPSVLRDADQLLTGEKQQRLSKS